MPGELHVVHVTALAADEAGSSFRFMRCPMPQTFSGVRTRISLGRLHLRGRTLGHGVHLLDAIIDLGRHHGRLLFGRAHLLGGVFRWPRRSCCSRCTGRGCRRSPNRMSSSEGSGLWSQQLLGGHEHSGRAVAALEAVLLPEALLQGMELSALRQALHRLHLEAPSACTANTVQLFTADAVQVDRARAAARRVAADVRPGERQVLTDEMDEQRTRRPPRFVYRVVLRSR